MNMDQDNIINNEMVEIDNSNNDKSIKKIVKID